MSEIDTSTGIDGLVRRTADMVELTMISNNNPNQRHMEYLPYPDWNLVEETHQCTDESLCSLEQIYSRHNKTFVSGLAVEIVKIDAERIYNPVTEFLYPYLYTMTVRHGPTFEWVIKKRYKHFHDLHKILVRYVETETGRSTSSLNKAQSSEIEVKDEEGHSLIKNQDDQPAFPTHNDRISFINRSSIADRCKLLQNYINKVLKHPKFREHMGVREFLEVSPLSFVRGLGKSVQEGAIAKRSKDDYRGRSIFLRAPFMCDTCKFHHGQKWFVLKDSYIVYMNPDSAVVGFPMLIDKGFSLERGFRKTGTNNGIKITNLQRSMTLKFEKEEERDHWFDSLNDVKNKCSLTEQHPFNSYAPKRTKQYAQWFINGQSYMEAVAKAVLAAREEIFITDWWLSPEIALIRPFDDDSMRLDNLLGKRAEEGIRVYIMVFKDIRNFLGLNSFHTKSKLMAKSPNKKNIKVIRHPDFRILPGTESSFYYSHHEKTFIIDQRVAFIGGIDLCWGRWDTDEHRLIDLSDENDLKLKLPDELANESEQEATKDEASVGITEKMAKNANNENSEASTNQTKSGKKSKANVIEQKLINDKITDSSSMTKTSGLTNLKEELERAERERLDEEEGVEHRPHKLENKFRKIFKKERKSYNEGSDDSDEEIPIEEPTDGKPETNIGVTPVVDKKCRFFLGKDYSNSYEKDFEFLEKFDEDYIDRKLRPRMPWHDEALVVTGEAARDCARHFIQRWNIHKADKLRFIESYPYILPKSYDDKELLDTSMLRSILGDEREPISVDAQCVRSCSFWSCGTITEEHSIQNAYVHMIENAQNFIYIENQFFVSIGQDATIKNGIGDALYRRIIRADANKEKFRVYVVLPLMPGFSNPNAVRAVMYFVMRSINKGETSLYQRLLLSGVTNPHDYVTFYGMRNWDILMGTLVTEIIYVHSKLMIVDDRMCICGSANINDRSLEGTRDSEFCLVINDLDMIDSKLNGQTQKVGRFSSTWRKKLFRQLLGVKNDEEVNVDDPCSDELYEYFRQTAKANGTIYEEVFNTLPTNHVRLLLNEEEYTDRPKLSETDPIAAHEKCKTIQGFIVEFPLEFLADEYLMPKWNTTEGIAPILLWT